MGHPLTSPPRRPVVLVCNTEPVLRMLVQATLELADFSVIDTSGGAEALAHIRDDHPDLIVLDTMSRISGRDVLAAVRNDPATAATPVIMLTTPAQTSPETDCAGELRYLVKPFSPRILATVAGALLDYREEPRQSFDLTSAP